MMNTKPKKTSQAGSALLITLLVVSLLLVMVLSFVAVVRMELRKVTSHQEMMQARANARLGGELAIARLQELSGLDTRVTLPAEADASVTAHSHARFWTGVRDAAVFNARQGDFEWNDNYSAHLGWLVSGNSPDPAQASLDGSGNALGDRVLLVGGGSVAAVDDRIAAPRVPIESPSGAEQGGLAWWVGEENTKAQVNLTNPFALNAPESAMTAQRTAAEQLLPTLDPANPLQQAQLDRMLSRRQLDLAEFQTLPNAVPGPELFHAITFGAFGLPTHARLGGLKRDLTPVFAEAWNNNGTPPTGAGTQFAALLQDQEQRITRLRQQTQALPATRPAGVPLHAWNVAQAMTLRAEQANLSDPGSNQGHAIPGLIFPPFSDMEVRNDLVPSWRQLISFATMNAPGRGLRGPQGYRIGRHRQDVIEPHPVIARMNMGIYFTFDGGNIRSHFVPQVVLWNPWSEPLAPQPLFVRFQYSNHLVESFKLFFRVSHPDWDGGSQRWTGGYSIDWAAPPGEHRNDRLFIFELEPTQIPAGGTVVFSMDRHRRFTMAGGPASSTNPFPWTTSPDQNAHNRDVSGFLSEAPRVTLRPGLHDGGGFSMYLEEDFHSKVIRYATIVPITGNYNSWRSPRFPIYHSNPDLSDVSEAQRNMAINEGGLSTSSGWRFHETRITWSRSDPSASSLGNVELSLGLTANHAVRSTNLSNQPLFSIRRPLSQMPSGFHSRGPGQGGWDALPRMAGLPPAFPGDSSPFTFDAADYPSFPTWGLSWGLRLPDTRFQPGEGTGSHLFAPLQWLAQSNPTAAYHTPTPNAGARGGGDQHNFGQTNSFVGGFTLQGAEFFDLSEFSDDDRHLFFGHSDHLAPLGFQTGQIPRAIVRQAPSSVDELTSIASLQHAPLLGMDLIRRPGNEWQGSNIPMHPNFWDNGGNLHPAYPIGNAMLMPFADPEQAYTNLFAIQVSPPAPPPPPWWFNYNDRFPGWRASPWYDLSWTLNHVLWDDYLFTSPANSRVVWNGGIEDRDYLRSAERMRIAGAFNVNSTSVRAWTALLASLLDVDIPNREGGSEVSDIERIPFARFLNPQSRAFSPDDGETYEFMSNFTGNRRLTLDEVERLAEEIVNQVRERGPFLSLSDFVNRRLLPAAQDADGHRLMGALQAAINAADLNASQMDAADPDSFILANNPALNTNAFHHWDKQSMAGATNRAAPGYLMQADLLSRIGAVLQVRSDTFLIRAYGETPSGARAWCEILVQRNPEYVDPADTPDALPGTLNSPVNERFGRRFEVIRFQWLGEEDV